MKPLPELLYNLAGLALVGALAYAWFWGFLVWIVPCLLVSLVLMVVERTVR